jgi:hypothetical protein
LRFNELPAAKVALSNKIIAFSLGTEAESSVPRDHCAVGLNRVVEESSREQS